MSPRQRSVSDEDVLRATANTIGRMGPGRLTLAEVARDAGIAPATLLQRFGSKRGLLLAFARQSGENLVARFQDERVSGQSPLRMLLALVRAQTLSVDSADALTNHLAFLQMDLNDSEFRGLAAEASERVRLALHGLLDAAVEAGELIRCDTSALARTIQAVFSGSLVVWAIHRNGAVDTWVRKDLEAALAPYRIQNSRRGGRE